MGPESVAFPPYPTAARLALAVGIGLFIGAERQRRQKEAGLRTFAFASLLGAVGGLLGPPYAPLSLILLGVLVVLLNIETMRSGEGAELTTSAALIVTGFVGLLAGQGHTFTPTTIGIMTAGLLAWKDRLVGFSVGLTEAEFRSAILLAIIAFVIYPLLPTGTIDPWQLVEPRSAWVTVLLIASLGFVNYVLLKMYGARGLALTGFLGGLINSTVVAGELARQATVAPHVLRPAIARAATLAITAMLLRNALILGVLSWMALVPVAAAFGLMLLVSVVLAFQGQAERSPEGPSDGSTIPQLPSPLSLWSALQFGALFVMIQVAGTLAQRAVGDSGLYAVSAAGGLVSSASAVAAAANLAANHSSEVATAGSAALLASLVSAWVNLPILARAGRDGELTKRIAVTMVLVTVAGVVGVIAYRVIAVDAWN